MASSEIPRTSELPQFPESLWKKTTEFPRFPRLQGESNADVVVVGGGITGLTAAYLLMQEGLQVALIEMGSLLHGTTGHTTAKITAQHGLIYDQLLDHFGAEKAKLYYEANEEAVQYMRRFAKENDIECGMVEEDAYLFAETDEELKKLEKEWEAYQKLGIPGEWLETLPLPFSGPERTFRTAAVNVHTARERSLGLNGYHVRTVSVKTREIHGSPVVEWKMRSGDRKIAGDRSALLRMQLQSAVNLVHLLGYGCMLVDGRSALLKFPHHKAQILEGVETGLAGHLDSPFDAERKRQRFQPLTGNAELESDEGAIVKHLGKRAGAYKDEQGNLFLVDATCTHMGCEVDWNPAERSWDCPCHGSRFNFKGEVIEGPATQPLTPLTQNEA